ncbi:hypothetical protein PsorP6_001831 [Peronosclerospora sorghi]|uniref:Uncharacterized protein n=1 Tax=Peronosclerospora sorghi TaxID=230839 RepID=A0ACC0WVR3_9STRA|nr:hypothetical protein PsorP6_001831 [Peronosclerospora sorghi]
MPAQYRADSIPAGTDSSAYAVNTSAQLDVQRDLRAIDKNATEAEDGERGRFPVIGESLASSSSGKRKVGEIVPEAVHVPENLEASHLENNQALIESMEKWIESIEEGQKIEISEVEAIASLLLDDSHISQKLGRNKLERYKLELMLIGHEIFTQLERRDPQWQTTNRRIRNERGNGRSDVMSIAKLVKSVGAIDKSDWYPSWVTFCRNSQLKFGELYVKLLWLHVSGQNKLGLEELAYMAAGSEYFKSIQNRVAKLSAAKEKASSVQPVPTRQNENMVPDPGQDKDEIDPTIDDFLDDPRFMVKLLKFAKVKGLTPELVRKRARHDLVADLLKKEAKKKRSE